MPETYSVKLTKDYLVFSAAHFITFDGNRCERLHGHNYQVEVDVFGPLDENQYVVDFIALRDELQAIVGDLDHRMLLPTEHPTIHVDAQDTSVEVTFEDRRWVFPRDDCKLLNIANTTTELLARHVGLELQRRMASRKIDGITGVRVAIDENLGQWGAWEWSA